MNNTEHSFESISTLSKFLDENPFTQPLGNIRLNLSFIEFGHDAAQELLLLLTSKKNLNLIRSLEVNLSHSLLFTEAVPHLCKLFLSAACPRGISVTCNRKLTEKFNTHLSSSDAVKELCETLKNITSPKIINIDFLQIDSKIPQLCASLHSQFIRGKAKELNHYTIALVVIYHIVIPKKMRANIKADDIITDRNAGVSCVPYYSAIMNILSFLTENIYDQLDILNALDLTSSVRQQSNRALPSSRQINEMSFFKLPEERLARLEKNAGNSCVIQ